MWRALIRLVDKWNCHHRWDLVNHTVINDPITRVPTGDIILYCCKICGKFKKIKI